MFFWSFSDKRSVKIKVVIFGYWSGKIQKWRCYFTKKLHVEFQTYWLLYGPKFEDVTKFRGVLLSAWEISEVGRKTYISQYYKAIYLFCKSEFKDILRNHLDNDHCLNITVTPKWLDIAIVSYLVSLFGLNNFFRNWSSKIFNKWS